MTNTEKTTAVDAPQFSFADVQRFTGLSKSDLQFYGRYIAPAEKAVGTGNRSKYSARNVFSFVIIDQLSRLYIPASVAGEWATTTFVLGEVAYAWFILPAVKKGNPPIGVEIKEVDFLDLTFRYTEGSRTFAIVPTGLIYADVLRKTGTQVSE